MKKLLSFICLLSLLTLYNPALAATRMATLVNPNTGYKVVVESGSQNASHYFSLGYVLYISGNLGYNVITNYKTTLSASMTSSQTTVPVSTMKTKDGHTIVTADVGGKVYLTVEPGGSSEEIILCTVVGASSFTGCTRGLAYYGTTTTAVAGNNKAHQSGSTVIMSNVNYTLKEFVDKDSNESIGGNKTFTGSTDFSKLPTSTTTTPTSNSQLATKKYVDDTAVAGAPDATSGVKGNVQLATTTAPSTIGKKLGSTGARLVLPAEMASSTSQAKEMIPVTDSSGKVDANFIDIESEGGLSVSSTKLQIKTPSGSKLILSSNGISLDYSNIYTLFGNGYDGDVTISSSTHLTRDTYYNNLTIDSGKVLNTNGYRLFVRDTLTNNGTIQRNGNNGSSASAGTAGVGALKLSAGTLKSCQGGSSGASGVSNGTGNVGVAGVSTTSATNVSGVVGGKGGDTATSTAGTAKVETVNFSTTLLVPAVLNSIVSLDPVQSFLSGTTTSTYLSSSAGSAGGSSGGSNNGTGVGGGGGGGGGAGGIVYISALTLINNGTIQALGGNGGNGGNGTLLASAYGGGGGGGGSGGLIVLIYKNITLGTISVAGGSKGLGGTGLAAANGNNGRDGLSGAIIKYVVN